MTYYSCSSDTDCKWFQMWLLNCGKTQKMLGQYTDNNMDELINDIKRYIDYYLPLDLEISITQTYSPYPEF